MLGQKKADTKDNVARNFGMASPGGYQGDAVNGTRKWDAH